MEIEDAHIEFYRSCQYKSHEEATAQGGCHRVMADGIYGYNTVRQILGAMQDAAECIEGGSSGSIRVIMVCDGDNLPECSLNEACEHLEAYHEKTNLSEGE